MVWWSLLASGLLGTSMSLVCPDGGTCQEGSTCCTDVAGRYGCCPLPRVSPHTPARLCTPNLGARAAPQDICCSNGIHCCPEGTQSVRALAVLCPDQHSECPGATTCCQLPDGSWGCCPLAKAVCCDDKRHCCPEGTACDLTRSRCVSAGRDWRGWQPLMSKLPAKPRVSAPGRACDVRGLAVCCDDGAHCCPNHTVCDLQQGICRPAEGHGRWLPKLPADVDCPNKTWTCPDETTCCQTSPGEYGCCPMPDATCCSDGLHCCPHGTICNLAAATCDDPANGAASVRAISPPNTKCNESMVCPGTSTCCQDVAGDWACCPLKEAVCCHDGFHCCPHGKRCNLEAKTCDDASGVAPPLPWLAKTTAVATGVTACDEHTSCPKGASCCFMKSAGKWGCCPLPQVTLHATTSYRAGSPHMPPDTRHCLTFHVCKYTNMPNCPLCPTLHKTSPITPSNMFESDRKCAWCPQAVCCQDGSHCCPAGHTCDPHRSSCSRGRRVVPWLTKTPAVARPPAVADVKCDDKSSCAAGTTCCKLPTGEWGCCPLVKVPFLVTL
uniref:Granulin b n=1 Tax=Hippocampus comes TaxID=109280 RepID=A0A3Q2ZK57_HIPCM